MAGMSDDDFEALLQTIKAGLALISATDDKRNALNVVHQLRRHRHDLVLTQFAASNPDIETNNGSGDVGWDRIKELLLLEDPQLDLGDIVITSTPDAVLVERSNDGTEVILNVMDIKTVQAIATADKTMVKYQTAYKILTDRCGIKVKVIIVNFSPRNGDFMVVPQSFQGRLNAFDEESVGRLLGLIDSAITTASMRFGNDLGFNQMYDDDDYRTHEPLTDPGINWRDKCLASQSFTEAMKSYPAKVKSILYKMADDSIDFEDEKYLDTVFERFIIDSSNQFRSYLNDYVNIPEKDLKFKRCTAAELNDAYREMEIKLRSRAKIIDTAKPSAFYLSYPPLQYAGTGNYTTIYNFVDKALKFTGSPVPLISLLKDLKGMDPDALNNRNYANQTTFLQFAEGQKLKMEATQYWKKMKEEARVGTGYIHTDPIHMVEDNLEDNKKQSLDFANEEYTQAVQQAMLNDFKILSRTSELVVNNHVLDFMDWDKLKVQNPELVNALHFIQKTRAVEWLNDEERNIQNMTALGNNLKHNEVAIVTGKSNSGLYFVYPTESLTTRGSTLCFQSMHLVKKTTETIDVDLIQNQIEIPKHDHRFVVSKPVRLNAPRLNHLSNCLTRFMLIAIKAFKDALDVHKRFKDIPKHLVESIIGTTFFLVQQVTLPFTSLVDGYKYMVQDILSESSNVLEYIRDKFSPCMKNRFTVYMYQHFKDTIIKMNTQFANCKTRDVQIDRSDILESGFLGFSIDSVIYRGQQLNRVDALAQDYTLAWYATPKNLQNDRHNMIKLYKVALDFQNDLNVSADSLTDPKLEQFAACVYTYFKERSSELYNARLNVIRYDRLRDDFINVKTLTSTKACVKRLSSQERLNREVATARLHDMSEKELLQNGYKKLDDGTIIEDRIGKIPLCLVDKSEWELVKSTKVFDESYELCKSLQDNGKSVCDLTDIVRQEPPVSTIFPKGQRTSTDREIYMSNFDTKVQLYFLEAIAKQVCNEDPREAITMSGDQKTRKVLSTLVQSFREVITKHREVDDTVDCDYQYMSTNLSTDASKWSARDLYDKYFFIFASMGQLTPNERWKCLYLLAHYRRKRLVLTDQMVQYLYPMNVSETNIFHKMTNGFKKNYVEITQNWFQGNLNYTSSLAHSIMHHTIDKVLVYYSGVIGYSRSFLGSAVHSDDAFAIIGAWVMKNVSQDVFNNAIYSLFSYVAKYFFITYNDKKSFISTRILEFLSKLCIGNEYHTGSMKDLLPMFSEFPYTQLSKDTLACLAPLLVGISGNCDPSLTTICRALCHYKFANLNALLPGMANSLAPMFKNNMAEFPSGYFGSLGTDDVDNVMLGGGASDYQRVYSIVRDRGYIGSTIEEMIESIAVDQMDEKDVEFLKLLDLSMAGTAIEIKKAGLAGIKDRDLRSDVFRSLAGNFEVTHRYHSTSDYLALKEKGYLDERLKNITETHPDWIMGLPESCKDYPEYVIYKLCEFEYRSSLFKGDTASSFVVKLINRNTKVISPRFLDNIQDHLLPNNKKEVISRDEYLTLKQAIAVVADKIQSMTMDDKQAKDLCKKILLSNQAVRNYFTIKHYLSIGPAMDRKANRAVKDRKELRTQVITGQPRKVVKFILFKKELPMEVETVGFFMHDVQCAHQILDALNLEEFYMHPERYTVEERQKVAILLFSQLTNIRPSNRVFMLPDSANNPIQFIRALMGSRHMDNYYRDVQVQNSKLFTILKAGKGGADAEQNDQLEQLWVFLKVANAICSQAVGRDVYVKVLKALRVDNRTVSDICNVSKDHRSAAICWGISYLLGTKSYLEFQEIAIRKQRSNRWEKVQENEDIGEFKVTYTDKGNYLTFEGTDLEYTDLTFNCPAALPDQRIAKTLLSRLTNDFPKFREMNDRRPFDASEQKMNFTVNDKKQAIIGAALPYYMAVNVHARENAVRLKEENYIERLNQYTFSDNRSLWGGLPAPFKIGGVAQDIKLPWVSDARNVGIESNVQLLVNGVDLVLLAKDISVRACAINNSRSFDCEAWANYIRKDTGGDTIKLAGRFMSGSHVGPTVGLLPSQNMLVRQDNSWDIEYNWINCLNDTLDIHKQIFSGTNRGLKSIALGAISEYNNNMYGSYLFLSCFDDSLSNMVARMREKLFNQPLSDARASHATVLMALQGSSATGLDVTKRSISKTIKKLDETITDSILDSDEDDKMDLEPAEEDEIKIELFSIMRYPKTEYPSLQPKGTRRRRPAPPMVAEANAVLYTVNQAFALDESFVEGTAVGDHPGAGPSFQQAGPMQNVLRPGILPPVDEATIAGILGPPDLELLEMEEDTLEPGDEWPFAQGDDIEGGNE